jgi:hypothetical protein
MAPTPTSARTNRPPVSSSSVWILASVDITAEV